VFTQAPATRKMVTREDDLKGLAITSRRPLRKRVNSTYPPALILSMALVEVLRALIAEEGDEGADNGTGCAPAGCCGADGTRAMPGAFSRQVGAGSCEASEQPPFH